MDLYAYNQIDELSKIAKDNNIEVPRLRGYRLMKDEEPVSAEELKRIMKDCEFDVCERLCCTRPFWNPNSCCLEFSSRTDYIEKYYLNRTTKEIRWDRIHGWKRKTLKFEIKKKKRRIQKQFDMYNKYAGKANVLCIHARIGGGNWHYFGGPELTKQPWFIEKVDDCYDNTYCDIYAHVK